MKPFMQGDLDYFCGLYALINASRLAMPSVARHQWQKIFVESLDWLHREQGIMYSQTYGFNINLLLTLHKRFFRPKLPQLALSRPFLRNTPPDSEIWRWLGENARPGQGIVAGFIHGEWDHWTVIRAITSDKVWLFDSDNEDPIESKNRSICGFTEDAECTIFPCSILLIKST